MRNSGMRGYYGYRGRRPGGRRWLVLALVLVILAAAAFLLAQRYMVYETDGSYHFELPWARHERTQSSAHFGRQDLEIVIEKPDTPAAQVSSVHAQELDASALSGDMARLLQALPEGIDAVAVRLKDGNGDLLYPSTLAEAAQANAVAGDSTAAGAIAALTKSEYYTIARLSALHDSRFSLANKTEAAVLQKRYKNEIWYAPDSTFYLAPEKELTRQYLAKIAGEVAALGFDELLFDDFAYPTNGRLYNIKTDERGMTEQEALSLLAGSLREAVLDCGVKLSVVMDAKTVLAGGDETSGQDLASLATAFDRIYVPATEEQLPALQEALAPYSAELVPILDSAPAEGGYLLSAAP